ncbi:MAG TPA: 50S ribosome-binding GTPase [Candidatus Atribacteria bacterium]|nr:50S ribosome-binding GTPase [Candidatus Atribacteria bacterium]
MPANLTPQYLEAEARYRSARTSEEKLKALEEMLAVIPKHKGTEKLQAEIKQKISKLRKSQGERKGKGKLFDPYLIEKVGAAQIAIIGTPNSGKSTLLSLLTRAHPEIADYPFTTHSPLPGMMEYQDIQIQLIDFPPWLEGKIEGNALSALRRADGVIVVMDGKSERVLEEMEGLLEDLEESKFELEKERSLILVNKIETPLEQETFSIFKELYEARFTIQGISLLTMSAEEKENLKRDIFYLAAIIRIYSKPPGKPPDLSRPFILKKGETVKDLACAIHKDLVHTLKGARVWGSAKFEGQLVTPDYILQDKDIVEIKA